MKRPVGKKRKGGPDRDPARQLRDDLRAAGLRSTGPRVAVLGALAGSGAARTHGEIAESLAHLGYDRATIYRNLMDLTQAGLVARTDLGDHVWRYELKRAREHTIDHPHLVCTRCGDVSCLEEVEVRIVAKPGARKPVGEVEVQLRGLCENCG